MVQDVLMPQGMSAQEWNTVLKEQENLLKNIKTSIKDRKEEVK